VLCVSFFPSDCPEQVLSPERWTPCPSQANKLTQASCVKLVGETEFDETLHFFHPSVFRSPFIEGRMPPGTILAIT